MKSPADPSGLCVLSVSMSVLNPRNTWHDTKRDDREAPELADTAVSAQVSSMNGVGIVAERAMWWPGPSASSWQEAHGSPGATSAAPRWAIADGELGGGRGVATYVLVANTSAIDSQVEVTLLFESAAPVSRTFAVRAHSRFNVDVAALFPEAHERRFGAVVQSLTAGASIVVERAIYWNANGVVWAAGTDSLAMPLP